MPTQHDDPIDPDAWQRAWLPVLDAIADAMDVPGLSPHDRGRMARLYEQAERAIGLQPLIAPDKPKPLAPWENKSFLRAVGVSDDDALQVEMELQRRHTASEPGGVKELTEYISVRGDEVVRKLWRDPNGPLTIDALERATDHELLSIDGIGPTRLKALRESVREYRAHRSRADRPTRKDVG